MTKPFLRLMGGCSLTLPGGEEIEIKGTKAPLVVAISALVGGGLSSQKMCELLSDGVKRPTNDNALRSLRSRLPEPIKKRLGKDSYPWVLADVIVDVDELRSDALDVLGKGADVDKESLEEVLKQVSLPLLAEIPPEGDHEIRWLVDQRDQLEQLRARLVAAAIGWADHHSDPWHQELMAQWSILRPGEVPPRAEPRPEPAPTSGSAISNIGMADARELIGRASELTGLRAQFEEGKSIQVIWGEGGIGKSDLALTYLHRHANEYGIRWKVSAETMVELLTDLRRLGRRLGIPSAESTSLHSDAADAERFMVDLGDHLASLAEGSWLLFFDNLVEPDALKGVLPHLPANGHVLITSQVPDWPDFFVKLHLEGLHPDDAVKLMAGTSYRLEGGSDDLQRICAALQFNPMLIKHAALTMFKDGIAPSDYFERLNKGLDEAVEMWPELDATGRHAITTYGLAIERAAVEAPGARALIETVSFLASEPVEEPLLSEGLVGALPEIPEKDSLVRARRALRNRSLLQINQHTESFSVHRVMQAVVRLRLGSDEARAERLGTAVEALERALPLPDSKNANERRRSLVPHIEALIPHVERSGTPSLRSRTAELASQLGLFYHLRSEWEAAEAAHDRAIELSRDDSDAAAAAMRNVRLAHVIRQRGRFDDAEKAIALALPALRESASPKDPGLAYAFTVQALILREKPASQPLAARYYLGQALDILDNGKKGEVRSEQLSRTLNYSAVLLRQLGEFEKAEEQSRRGFELLTGMTPEEWMARPTPEAPPRRLLAFHLRSLGNLWRLLGRFDDARRAHERALTIISVLHEKNDHADAGRCLDSLGRVQREYGDFEDALKNFEQARRISDLRFGAGHPYAATAMTNIAATLRETGDLDDALSAIEWAVAIYRRSYGDTWSEGRGELHNEHTAWAVFVRAEINVSRGDAAIAAPDHRQVLRLRRKLYGRRDHPNFAASLQGMADVAALEGRREEALRLNRKAKEMRLRIFGSDGNYWVAHSNLRLGELLEEPGQKEVHLRSAGKAWGAQLSPTHPRLARVNELLAELPK